jgi:DME family drug/metabolite transporter
MPEGTVQNPTSDATRRRLGFAMALGAGFCWGTTGPLSTALYAEGAALTAIGFWRIALAAIALGAWGLLRRDLFVVDRPGLLVVGLLGGACVAGFEVAYQFAIAGVGVAGAAALLYTAPVLVAVAARLVLGEALTPLRLGLALFVMVGATLTVRGGTGVETLFASREQGMLLGVIGGLTAAVSYAGTTLIGRWAVPRYGPLRVLWLEIAGGTVLLATLLPLVGETPALPPGVGAWIYVGLLAAGTVVAANVLFFGALRRVEAAPVSVAATIEPVAGALLALLLLGQSLTALGWFGLVLVVASVAAGYLTEAARPGGRRREPPLDPRTAGR